TPGELAVGHRDDAAPQALVGSAGRGADLRARTLWSARMPADTWGMLGLGLGDRARSTTPRRGLRVNWAAVAPYGFIGAATRSRGLRGGSRRRAGRTGGDHPRVRDRLLRDRPADQRRALLRLPDLRRTGRQLHAGRGRARAADDLRHADRRVPGAGDRPQRAASPE